MPRPPRPSGEGSLTVEVGPVDLVEEQIELRRLRLHHTVQRHTHFEMSLEFSADDRGRQSRSVLWLRGIIWLSIPIKLSLQPITDA